MDGFWHALVRLNARYLAMGAAAVLMLTMIAWLVSFMPGRGAHDAAAAMPAPEPGGGAREAAAPGDPGEALDVTPSPFESKHLSELVALSDEGLLRWDTPSTDPPRVSPPEASPPEEPEEPPEPRTVNVLYLGMMTRTDGSTVAILQNENEPRPAGYTLGAAFIDGVRISDIQRGHVAVDVGDTTVTLSRGVRQALEY